MIVGVPKELYPGERRVAMVPDVAQQLIRKGHEVLLEKGAGYDAGFTDQAYEAKGVKLVDSRDEVFQKADIIAQVRAYGADDQEGKGDLDKFKEGQLVIGFSDPLANAEEVKKFAEKKVSSFPMELIPRITRAQSMDALSSQASIAGYKAVLLGADSLPKIFPMMMTAAGTIAPAKVFVIGAGVAGLQAIATAKRLGAVVTAYDVRPEVREEIQSLGGKFLEIELEATEGEGGYAAEQSEEFIKAQQKAQAKAIGESDVVITTAAIPGKKSPMLVPADQVKAMKPGSVIVDLASERGGNCELTKHGETVVEHGVTIIGPANINSMVPAHSSQVYAKNIANLINHLVNKEGELVIDLEDDVTGGTIATKDGEIVHPRIREALGMPALEKPKKEENEDTESKEG